MHEDSSSGKVSTSSGPWQDELYVELVRIARAELLRHRRHGTLDTRALVHETWIRLSPREPEKYANRVHFYATAARAMRCVVLDYARARNAQRRNDGEAAIALEDADEAALALDAQLDRLVQMDAALQQLSQADPRLVQIAEMRWFGGLEVAEIAQLLGVSEPTVKRDTRVARAFLEKALSGE